YFSKHHTLFCFTLENNDPSYADYKIYNELSNSSLRYINPFYFLNLKRIIRENSITHVIIEHPYYGWMGLLLKHFCGVKLIIHSHNIESERFKSIGKWWWKIMWYYEKWIHTKANFTFCISEEDQDYFIENYNIKPSETAVITFGFPMQNIPPDTELKYARSILLNKYNLADNTRLFLFNGALGYEPNTDAVKNIVEHINPVFIKKNLDYKIIICGKDLPATMNELKEYAGENIIYAGFVDDISIYCKGCDVFINPVQIGGGIKTKLVEALGYNMNVVSSLNGAIGVDTKICEGKLLVCENNAWEDFADKMQQACLYEANTPAQFFENFYWGNISQKAANIIEGL
ncbi:MAG: glycosyltransferase family 4 protein, partial [Ginsengibacter sp.]